MSDLGDLLSADLLDALDRFVRERIAEALVAQPDGSPWLTLEQAARYVGVSLRTIERRVQAGGVRSTNVGRRRIVHRDDLDALLLSGR